MIFLYPQTKHPLIPQAHDSNLDASLATETKEFRGQFFQLLQTKVDEFSSTYTDKNPQQLYWQVRKDLDTCGEIQQAHQKRMELQDLLWNQVAEAIELDYTRLEQEYDLNSNLNMGGKLELNPVLNIPLHQLKTDIHRMPGGYLKNDSEHDFFTGIMYDHGVFIYGQGWLGSLNDELGNTIINKVIKEYYPEFQPHKILDLGCSVGHSTLAYTGEYPEAEVWGVDIGASLLRYAHARANALNQKVHFVQQNAEKTDFADQSFDLVVSHILFHEIPDIARQRVFKESYRLLKPGGLMIHLDSSLFLSPPSIFARYFRDTEVWVNSEPFLGSSQFHNFTNFALEAGFDPEQFKINRVAGYYAEQNGNDRAGWIAFCGQKI
jgi:SAM-dependent methyltransferase